MSHNSSKFWTFFALPASLLILASAYYVRVSAVRRAIDARTSIVRKVLGRFVPDEPSAGVAENAARSIHPTAGPGTTSPSVTTPSGTGGAAGGGSAAATPRAPRVFDLQELARDRSLWPKKVTLKKPTTFPAVVNGKVVGNLVAPAGTEANLKAIKDGQVGLEYEGGGAWLAVGDTDLASRVLLQ